MIHSKVKGHVYSEKALGYGDGQIYNDIRIPCVCRENRACAHSVYQAFSLAEGGAWGRGYLPIRLHDRYCARNFGHVANFCTNIAGLILRLARTF